MLVLVASDGAPKSPALDDTEPGEPEIAAGIALTVTGVVRRRHAVADDERPVRIGRFVIIDALGAGGMGAVYSAFDPKLERVVAVKLLRARADHSRHAERLVREAQAMAKLAHPNVLPVFEVDEHEGRVFLAMEIVKGRTLRGWLGAQPRTLIEILDAFEQAARGLQAAHAEGLVHRDFKPDNVMVGDDGRVRVMDFGLVLVAGESSESPSSDVRNASDQLTRTGNVLGTPAYMAPEQYAREPVDARTDQFAFCVALWEAVYGERPFAGDSLPALAAAVSEGRRRPTPPGRRVPPWLARVLDRGLAIDPSQRFANFDDLVSAIGRGRSRRRISAWLVGGAAGLAGVTALAGYQRWDETRARAQCEQDGTDAIAEVWNDDAQERVRSGLVATGIATAEATADRTIASLAAQAERWQQARVEACIAGEVTHEYDAETLDRAMWCLDQRRIQLDAFVDAIEHASAPALHRASAAAAELPSMAMCVDRARLERLPLPPTADRAEIREVHTLLGRAGELDRTAQYEESEAAAREGLARAQELDWLPLVGWAHLALARTLNHGGSPDEAEAAAEEAYFAATRAGDPNTQAHAALELMGLAGHELGRPTDGRRWGRLCEIALDDLGVAEGDLLHGYHLGALALIESTEGHHELALELHERALAIKRATLGDDALAVATSLANVATQQLELAHFDEASALLRDALKIREAALGRDHPSVATTLGYLAVVIHRSGDAREAAALQERALAIMEATLPPDHPDIAVALLNLGVSMSSLEEPTRARALFERALDITEKAYGPKHPDVARLLANLSEIDSELGHHAEAVKMGERGLAIAEDLLGPDHPDVGARASALATIHTRAGDVAVARALYERAIAIEEKALGPDHPDVAMSVANLGIHRMMTGDPEGAERLLERARGILERSFGPDDPRAVQALVEIGRARVARGHHADAIAAFERALERLGTREGTRDTRALAHFSLAGALVESHGDRGRAVAEAERAAVLLREGGEAEAHKLDEVEAWLTEHSAAE